MSTTATKADLARESSIRLRLDSEVKVYQQLCDRHDAEQRALRTKLRDTEARSNRLQNEARVAEVKLRQLQISSADEMEHKVQELRAAAAFRESNAQHAEEQLKERLHVAEDAKTKADARALGFQEAAMAVMKKLAAVEREGAAQEVRPLAGRELGPAQRWPVGEASPVSVQLRILEELYSTASSRAQRLRASTEYEKS